MVFPVKLEFTSSKVELESESSPPQSEPWRKLAEVENAIYGPKVTSADHARSESTIAEFRGELRRSSSPTKEERNISTLVLPDFREWNRWEDERRNSTVAWFSKTAAICPTLLALPLFLVTPKLGIAFYRMLYSSRKNTH